jgi:hypothetical protein
MKYYPSSRIVTGYKTNGTEFTVDGVPYTGPYYKTFDNKALAGYNPVVGSNKLLVPIKILNTGTDSSAGNTFINSDITAFNESADYLASRKINPVDLGEFKQPIPYYPNPTLKDYSKGFIMRYFCKKRNLDGGIVEVNKETFLSLQDVSSEYDYIANIAIDLFWQISGPLNDYVQTNGVRVSGIIDTNKRLVASKSIKFRGLEEFIGGNYTKFAKPR